MRKANSVAKVAITAGLAFGLIASGAATAQADPTPAGSRSTVAVGSDTIQDLYNAFQASNANLGSYDAFGTTLDITPKTGGATFYRPAGSGDGVKALSASWSTTKNFFSFTKAPTSAVPNPVAENSPNMQPGGVHTVDIARSSSQPSAAVAAGAPNDKLTFVPLGRDAVSVAVQTSGITGSAVPTNFTTGELTAIFGGGTSGRITTAGTGSSDPVFVDGTTTVTLHPELPQASSGTRGFFLKAIGLTNATIGTWVEQANAPENSAASIDTTGDISPFSVGQWISQKNGVVTPSTFTGTNSATLALTKVDGKSPFKQKLEAGVLVTDSPLAPGVNSSSPAYQGLYGDASTDPFVANGSAALGLFARDVYSVVPTANYTGAFATYLNTTLRAQTDSTGKNLVQKFGFARLSYTTAGLGEYHSNWTN